MAKTNFSIQPLDRSNYHLLVPLMKDCFGMDVTPRYFEWKYFDNPAGNCVGFIAIDTTSNNAVAFYGLMPQVYLVNGKETIFYQSCDTMTHTTHRKKSMFPVLARECFRYLEDRNLYLMMGIGGTAQTYPVLAHFGWKVVSQFRIYFKLNISCFSYIFKSFKSSDFSETTSIDELEQLISTQKPSTEIQSPRTVSHYKWRIGNPNFQYKIVSYKEGIATSGMAVYYIQNNKIFLFDFIFTNDKSRRALTWYLSKLVIKKKYKGIIAFCQEGGAQSRALRKSGFISNPFNKGPLSNKSPFFVYADEERMPFFTDPAKWSITAYDYDAS